MPHFLLPIITFNKDLWGSDNRFIIIRAIRAQFWIAPRKPANNEHSNNPTGENGERHSYQRGHYTRLQLSHLGSAKSHDHLHSIHPAPQSCWRPLLTNVAAYDGRKHIAYSRQAKEDRREDKA